MTIEDVLWSLYEFHLSLKMKYFTTDTFLTNYYHYFPPLPQHGDQGKFQMQDFQAVFLAPLKH